MFIVTKYNTFNNTKQAKNYRANFILTNKSSSNDF